MRKNKFVVLVNKPILNSGLLKRLMAMYLTNEGELSVPTKNPLAQSNYEPELLKSSQKLTSKLKPK